MKDKPKLGRGLEDVSSYFLSRTHEIQEEPVNASPAPAVLRSVTICCPGSGSLQACFAANLALEAAKRRHPVQVWDRSGPEEPGVKGMMQAILSAEESRPGTSHASLYGLPEITIKKVNQGEPDRGEGAGDDSGGRYLLVNAAASLDAVLDGDLPDDCIVITKTDEKSLLKAYAFIRTAHAKNPDAGFHVIFASDQEEGDEKMVFRRFSGFLEAYSGCIVQYLGSLVQDEQLAVSVSEAKPLVLSRTGSKSLDCIMGICSRFFNGKPAQAGRDGSSCAS